MEQKYRSTSEVKAEMAKITQAKVNILTKIEQLNREESDLKDQVGEVILLGKSSESSAKLEKVQRDLITHTLALGSADNTLVWLESELSNAKVQESAARWKQLLAGMQKQVDELEAFSVALVEKAAKFQVYLNEHREEVGALGSDPSSLFDKIYTLVHNQFEAETQQLKELRRIKSIYLKAD